MSERGVFAVDRGVFGHEMFDDEPYTQREAFIWLLSEAAYKDRKKRIGPHVYDLKRGQVAHSIRFMADCWKWKKSKVESFIKRLVDEGTISKRSRTVTGQSVNVLTFCNYNAYQILALPKLDVDQTVNGQSRDKLEDTKYIETDKTVSNETVVNTQKRADPLPVKEAFDNWNLLAQELGLPSAETLTPERRRKLRARLNEHGGLDTWNRALRNIASSPFLLGKNNREWRASLDFMLQPSSFVKVLEGQYQEAVN